MAYVKQMSMQILRKIKANFGRDEVELKAAAYLKAGAEKAKADVEKS